MIESYIELPNHERQIRRNSHQFRNQKKLKCCNEASLMSRPCSKNNNVKVNISASLKHTHQTREKSNLLQEKSDNNDRYKVLSSAIHRRSRIVSEHQKVIFMILAIVLLPSTCCKAKLNLNLNLDEEDSATNLLQTSTQQYSSESGNISETNQLTHIPSSSSSNPNRVNQQQSTSRTTNHSRASNKLASQLKRTQAAQAAYLQFAETELLPFSDFDVKQPAFSDLMRSWPPTTQQAANSLLLLKQRQADAAASARRNQASSSPLPSHLHTPTYSAQADDPARNHLNEDLDDTLVTADLDFKDAAIPEPVSWINYLGEQGDQIYLQLKLLQEQQANLLVSSDAGEAGGGETSSSKQSGDQNLSTQLASKLEALEETLDDYYYGQYENSQVLYYGPQLVREGDLLEIGCYLPSEHPAEWTRSGRPLLSGVGSPRAVRSKNFLGAKLNFSLKIYEASLSDGGNYRCNKMSRKYHKLVVVPARTNNIQLYLIQQRLLSVVKPSAVSWSESSSQAASNPLLPVRASSTTKAQSSPGKAHKQLPGSNRTSVATAQSRSRGQAPANVSLTLLPGRLIIENEPLLVNCNITDESVLRRLRENPYFQLDWFKNGKLITRLPTSNLPASSGVRARQLAPAGGVLGTMNKPAGGPPSSQRIQFVGLNGRQLYISSALYADAGDYLCSWSQLSAAAAPRAPNPAKQQRPGSRNSFASSDNSADLGASEARDGGDEASQEAKNSGDAKLEDGESGEQAIDKQQRSLVPLAAGALVQLITPVKLRPFKSSYHLRRGNQLRIFCQAQRSFPAPQFSWYLGNRLLDAQFLREHPGEFQIIQLTNQDQLLSLGAVSKPASQQSDNDESARQIVELNPVPSNQLRAKFPLLAGRGHWIEYRELGAEKTSIEKRNQQLRYMQFKLGQLNGINQSSSSLSVQQQQSSALVTRATPSPSSAEQAGGGGGLLGQAALSMLVVNSLDEEKHNSRFACRATTRANTDEVTTLIRVQASSTILVRPSSGRATLIPGQPLHFECEQTGKLHPSFIWYKRDIGSSTDQLLEPNVDEAVEIHNERLTLKPPNTSFAADYICKALKTDSGGKLEFDPKEFAIIKVRTQPYIDDFGLETSHTGRSSIITEGDRLELTCTVRDKSAPVNITWLRSLTPDDEKTMLPIPESGEAGSVNNLGTENTATSGAQIWQFTNSLSSVLIEKVNPFTKKLIIESVKHEHRSYYACIADNGVTERARKIILIRVKDKLVSLWPFLGIVAELIILFTIIYVWETQRAYKEIHAAPGTSLAASGVTTASGGTNKRQPVGGSAAFENVPLTNG